MRIEKTVRDLYWLYRRLLINSLCYILAPFCRHDRTTDIRNARRILVMAQDGKIGDFILLSPFLKALRKTLPDSYIALGVSTKTFQLAENCPYADKIIKLPDQKPHSLISKLIRNFILARELIAPENFDAAILTVDNIDYYLASFMIFFAGIPSRIAYGRETFGLHPRKKDLQLDLLLTLPLRFHPDKLHQTEIFLNILDELGLEYIQEPPEIWYSKDALSRAGEILKEINREKRPLWGLCISAAASKRNWPLENYATLVKCLSEKYKPFWLFTGLPEDSAYFEKIFHGLDPNAAVNLAGKINLQVLFLLLKESDLFIGPDSGLAHIAALASKNLVEISCHPVSGSPYSINSPERFAPKGNNIIIVRPAMPMDDCTFECTATVPHCIKNVQVSDVAEAIARCIKVF